MDNEEKMKKLLQAICQPVSASPEFKARLLRRLTQEVSRRRLRAPRRLWSKPLLWAPVAAVVALALILFFVFMGLPGQSPGVVEPPTSESDTPDSITPEAPSTSTTPLTVSTGILKIFVTDAPPQYNFTEINVILGNIQVSKDETAEDDSSWVTIVEGENSFDLIQLRDSSLAEFLGEASLDTGIYYQIRMDVTFVNAFIDNEMVDTEIKFPSEKLKMVRSFEIKENQTTVVTIDFDAAESLVFTGSDKVIFKPVVKLLVEYE